MRIVRLLSLGIFFSCVALSPSMAKETIVIAAFGDSLAAGYGVAPDEAFPAQLEKKLNGGGYNVKMINDGVSGDTTAGGVARVDSVIEQKPGVVILVLGGNDLLRALPPEETRKNLEIIVDKLQKAHIKILVTGQKAPLTMGMKYMQNYNPIFCEVAAAHDALCYPFFLQDIYGHPDLMQQDGIHPNAQGAALVVNNLYPQVVKLLK